MKQVIVFPRGQLSAKDRERLTKAGFIAVEADTPHQVVTVLPGSQLVGGDDITFAFMNALLTSKYGGDELRGQFALHLAKRITKRDELATSAA